VSLIVPFILQKHEAIKAGTHYDLRIRYPHKNKLASWAIPKARIPKSSNDRTLAIQTQDHDISWLKFSGEIPEGSYGHGFVHIIQKGECEIIQWTDKVISFDVKGQYMDGRFHLIRIREKLNKFQKEWLLIRARYES